MTLVGPGFHFKRLFLPFLAAFGDLTWRITRLVEMQNRKILKKFQNCFHFVELKIGQFFTSVFYH